MPTLSSIVTSIKGVLQDPAYTDPVIVNKVNALVARIAAGVRMPNGQISPPLSDLYAYGTVSTAAALPYVSLPDNYQRNISIIYDSGNLVISPPRGGDYYSFSLFLKQITNMNLAEIGSINKVCVKGSKVYYQGIPSVSTTLGLHYYRKPIDMALDDDEPDGVPAHIAEDLIKHGVLKDIFGEKIEDGQDNSGIGTKYHTAKFYEYMTDLVDFIGIDAEPQHYGAGGAEDYGACD
jgi:hypothetical protein